MSAAEENMSEKNVSIDRPLSAEGPTPPAGVAADAASARGNGTLRPLPDDALIILPVRNVVMFPGAVFPLTV